MDYPLGVFRRAAGLISFTVLIPILMDYPLGVEGSAIEESLKFGLNPYSNGLPSRGEQQRVKRSCTGVS